MDQKEIKDLPNEILMRIFEYLNFDDFKDASLVCHQWYDITHTNRFLPSLSIVKVPKLHKDEDLEFLNNTKNFHNFKNWSIEDYEQLLLNEKCQFHQRESIKFLKIFTEIITIDYIIDVILKFKNLEEFNLKFDLLTRDETFKESKNIRNLKSLTLFVSGLTGFYYTTNYGQFDLINILDLFSNIESLEINEYPIDQKHIDFIISKFGRTLKELHLASEELEHMIKLSNLNLKKLSCNSTVLVFSNFEEFLKTQNDLVSLNLSCGVFLDYEFIAKIIENLKNLEEFKVDCKDDSLFKIMKLKNLKKLYANWEITTDMQELYTGVSNGENNVLYKLSVNCTIETEILSTFFKEKFPNLRALNLRHCFKVVTDSVLQSVIRNCRNLLHLNLTNCISITDKGITGMNFNEDNGETGVSIANLKGLRSLDLSKCNITDFSLEFGLKFLELRVLNLSDCEHITINGLQHVAQNCPSLVRLDIDQKFKYNKKLSSKFKKLRMPKSLFENFVYFKL